MSVIDDAEHYTIITADSHAGGSHAQYREYLDKRYRDDFDAWRGEYKNPYKDLGDTRKLRNWDDELRNSQQEADGIVAEVVFPNTVPPFFPSFVLFAKPPKPEEYEHRIAGVRAHNRWLVDFCNEFPDRRAGVGQIFLNDVDDALDDVRWIKEHGLRGGVLLPNIPPDCPWMRPLHDPCYDPVWELCQDLEVPVTIHGGTGNPDYGPYAVSMLLYITETGFYSQRPLSQFILSGVFERFPRLKFVMTEVGCAWVPPLLERLDGTIRSIRDTGATGEIRYGDDHVLKKDASEYFAQNVWIGVSQPGLADVAARHVVGVDRFMWGSDYPHDEGTHPYTREHLRSRFADVDPAEVKMMLTDNAADLYGFDVDALAPLGKKFGPTVGEIRTPIDEVPDKTLERLSGDMDPKAIK
ncbi:amidohydrolase family protein [Actinospongicola halichondriae]|uniref:amidohydrolase family protein n=1 Tax=Actinospongicola halichondriae TaxID=3236844 RepID=UPI003D4AF9A5